MHYMLCKHSVVDFDRWYKVFKANQEAAEEAGLHLLYLLHDASDRNRVVYLFRVDDVAKARAFTEAPEASDAGEESGVLEPFELMYLDD